MIFCAELNTVRKESSVPPAKKSGLHRIYRACCAIHRGPIPAIKLFKLNVVRA